MIRLFGKMQLYIEGYLQAMLDTVYKQEYLRVRVVDNQVTQFIFNILFSIMFPLWLSKFLPGWSLRNLALRALLRQKRPSEYDISISKN